MQFVSYHAKQYDATHIQQKQGTVNATSDITEAKYLFDKGMLSAFSVENVCSAGVLVMIKGNWMT